jgi:hypothetical protein
MRKLRIDREGGLICYTDHSKTNKGTGAGVYGCGMRWNPTFSLEQYTVVFWAEVYAITAHMVEYLDRKYRNRNIYILSDNQAAIESLGNHQGT